MRESGVKTVMADTKDPQSNHGLEPDEIGLSFDHRKALDHLFSVTYEELRRLASSVRRGDPSATLSPTALVNEAWLKLAKSPKIAASSQLYFKRIAARAMRQLLVEAARRRTADKRGGGADVTVTFDDNVQKKSSGGEELLALNTALDSLARMNPRQAVMVEGRFRRAECAGDRGIAEYFRSHRTSRLASGEGRRRLGAPARRHDRFRAAGTRRQRTRLLPGGLETRTAAGARRLLECSGPLTHRVWSWARMVSPRNGTLLRIARRVVPRSAAEHFVIRCPT